MMVAILLFLHKEEEGLLFESWHNVRALSSRLILLAL